MDELGALERLAKPLIDQSLGVHVCVVCGNDLFRGEVFSFHDEGDCPLVAAMKLLPDSWDEIDG